MATYLQTMCGISIRVDVAAGRALLAGRAIEYEAHKVLARRGITSPTYEEKVSALHDASRMLAALGPAYDQGVKRP